MKKNLYVVKIFREVFSEKEICRLYCIGKDSAGVEKRVLEVLSSQHDFEKLGLDKELVFVSAYKVDNEADEKIIKRFCVVCEW